MGMGEGRRQAAYEIVHGDTRDLPDVRDFVETLGTIALPPDLGVWGLDSGVRHSVGGGDYGPVRVGAFMGYRNVAGLAGMQVGPNGEAVSIEDARWGGYLANLPRQSSSRSSPRSCRRG